MNPMSFRVLPIADVRRPLDYFKCAPYACTITAATCVSRQGLGQEKKKGSQTGPAENFALCHDCDDGPAIVAAIGGGPAVARGGFVQASPAGEPAPRAARGAPRAQPKKAGDDWRSRPRGPNKCGSCGIVGHKANRCPGGTPASAPASAVGRVPAPRRPMVVAADVPDEDEYEVPVSPKLPPPAPPAPPAPVVVVPPPSPCAPALAAPAASPFASVLAVLDRARPRAEAPADDLLGVVEQVEREGVELAKALRGREAALVEQLAAVRAALARLRWAEREPRAPFEVGQVVLYTRDDSRKGQRFRVLEVQARPAWSSGWGLRVEPADKKTKGWPFRGVTASSRFAPIPEASEGAA